MKNKLFEEKVFTDLLTPVNSKFFYLKVAIGC